MLAARRILTASNARCLSTIPVNQIASVLKLNVANEANALIMDEHVKQLNAKMIGHPGFVRTNRYVCKSEWAYELSFLFKDIDSFKAWKTCAIRDDVHATYLEALKKIDVAEDKVYAGARVYDEFTA